MRGFALLMLMLVLLVAACAGKPSPGGNAANDPEATPQPPDPAVLAAWDSFPAEARPRPLVISELPAVTSGGFADSAAKEAVLAGRYTLGVALPPVPPANVRVALPDGSATVATITAEQAFDKLTATSRPGQGPVARINTITFASTMFTSDRGKIDLPSWFFNFGSGAIAWPAVIPAAIWRPSGTILDLSSGATVSADGMQLTVALPAPAPGCVETDRPRWTAVAVESPHAVVVGLTARPAETGPSVAAAACGGECPTCASPAVGPQASYLVRLAAPLGGRVLLRSDGAGPPTVQTVLPA